MSDPDEVWVVLHKSGRVASVWSERAEADDNVWGPLAHVTRYIRADRYAELESAVAELVDQWTKTND